MPSRGWPLLVSVVWPAVALGQNYFERIGHSTPGESLRFVSASKDGQRLLCRGEVAYAAWSRSDGLTEISEGGTPRAISNNGTVYGVGPPYRRDADGTLTMLTMPVDAELVDVDASGAIVLGYVQDEVVGSRPFVYRSDSDTVDWVPLEPGATLVQVRGLSAAGRFVLYTRREPSCNGWSAVLHDLELHSDRLIAAPVCYESAFAVFDSGPGVIGYDGGSPSYAWKWVAGEFSELATGGNMYPRVASQDGTVIGGLGTTHCGLPEVVLLDGRDQDCLRLLLARKYGLPTATLSFTEIPAITADGRTLAGELIDADGQTCVWSARIEAPLDPPHCPADVDYSGFVDTDDFDVFVHEFEGGGSNADFDGSCFVDTDDFDAFVGAFESGC